MFNDLSIWPLDSPTRSMRTTNGGKIPIFLNNVSYFFDRDINDSIDKLEPVLQTALMATIGAVVLWLALSVLGPIYDTISTIDF